MILTPLVPRNQTPASARHVTTAAPLLLLYCTAVPVIRDVGEPYLALLWEASESAGSLPHPLLMGPEHLELLQVLHEPHSLLKK